MICISFDDYRDIIEQLGHVHILDYVPSEFTQGVQHRKDVMLGCPFHKEKTPSFHIYPSKTGKYFYHCFGCHQSGDIFSFVGAQYGLNFMEALAHIAQKEGVELPAKSNTPKKNLSQIFVTAQQYYSRLLENSPAHEYLLHRGVSEELIRKYSLGYSLPNGGLREHLLEAGFELSDIAKTGLIRLSRDADIRTTNPHDFYDAFRNRVMIPLQDALGKVVAFNSRSLNPEEKEKKYLHSSVETEFGPTGFNKKKMLYGFNNLIEFLRKQKGTKRVYVSEGCFDVMTAGEYIPVVGLLTAHFTDEQAKRLATSVDELVFLLDSDEAGIRGAKKAAKVAFEHDISVKVKFIPQLNGRKQDLDSLAVLHKDQLPAYLDQLREHDIITMHTVERTLSLDEKLPILSEVAEAVAGAPDLSTQLLYLTHAMDVLQITSPVSLAQRVFEKANGLTQVPGKNMVIEKVFAQFLIGVLCEPAIESTTYLREIAPESPVVPDSSRLLYAHVRNERLSNTALGPALAINTGDLFRTEQRRATTDYLKELGQTHGLPIPGVILTTLIENGTPNIHSSAHAVLKLQQHAQYAQQLHALVEGDGSTLLEYCTQQFEDFIHGTNTSGRSTVQT